MIDKELLELHGLIVGDGTYYLDRGKYSHMTLCNFDLNLMKRAKRICERFSKKKIKISSRPRKTGVEYSMNIPIIVTRKLIEQGFNKKKLSSSIINDENSIFFIKGLYESDGSSHCSQIYIHQKNAEQLLADCQKILNSNGLSAHIHNSSPNRKGEQYLVIENSNRAKRFFGKSPKKIKIFDHKIRGYHFTKRAILSILNDESWKSTSELYKCLEKKGIKISRGSNVLLHKHLNKLFKSDVLEKRDSIIKRNELGQFQKSECVWKLKNNLTNEQIMNFPYGVLK